jgi:ribonuclease Z
VDLLLCEATFLDAEVDLAVAYGHLTARQAATIARQAGVRRLVLTHLSARYPDREGHLAEAREVFPEVVVAEDLDVIPVPPR